MKSTIALPRYTGMQYMTVLFAVVVCGFFTNSRVQAAEANQPPALRHAYEMIGSPKPVAVAPVAVVTPRPEEVIVSVAPPKAKAKAKVKVAAKKSKAKSKLLICQDELTAANKWLDKYAENLKTAKGKISELNTQLTAAQGNLARAKAAELKAEGGLDVAKTALSDSAGTAKWALILLIIAAVIMIATIAYAIKTSRQADDAEARLRNFSNQNSTLHADLQHANDWAARAEARHPGLAEDLKADAAAHNRQA